MEGCRKRDILMGQRSALEVSPRPEHEEGERAMQWTAPHHSCYASLQRLEFYVVYPEFTLNACFSRTT
jgi:hypothetical protein